MNPTEPNLIDLFYSSLPLESSNSEREGKGVLAKDHCIGCGALTIGDLCRVCGTCPSCGKKLTADEVRLCIKHGWKIEHTRCMTIERRAEIENSPVTITQGHLDYLNRCRLLLEPVKELSAESNEKDSELKTYSFVHEMTLDEKFIFMRRMEAISATLSILLKADKKAIADELAKRDAKKFEEARQVRNVENRPKKEKKQLSDREKAIASILALPGLTREVAEKMVDEQFKKQGKVTA